MGTTIYQVCSVKSWPKQWRHAVGVIITDILLTIAYTIGWFFTSHSLCMLTGGRTLAMKIQQAIVMGVLSTILHETLKALIG